MLEILLLYFPNETWTLMLLNQLRWRKKTYFCIPTSRVQTCRKLMWNANCFISYVQNCIFVFQRGGYATIAIQLRKVNKGSQERRILEKMIICFKKMYHLDYIVICKKKIPICFKKFQMFQGLCLLQYTEGS